MEPVLSTTHIAVARFRQRKLIYGRYKKGEIEGKEQCTSSMNINITIANGSCHRGTSLANKGINHDSLLT